VNRDLNEKESFEFIKPLCRELYELIKENHIEFVSGYYNEANSTYKINIKSNRLHFASRGLKDSIGDLEYEKGRLRIGLRSNGIPANVFVELKE
jgi:hypothetical protein